MTITANSSKSSVFGQNVDYNNVPIHLIPSNPTTLEQRVNEIGQEAIDLQEEKGALNCILRPFKNILSGWENLYYSGSYRCEGASSNWRESAAAGALCCTCPLCLCFSGASCYYAYAQTAYTCCGKVTAACIGATILSPVATGILMTLSYPLCCCLWCVGTCVLEEACKQHHHYCSSGELQPLEINHP